MLLSLNNPSVAATIGDASDVPSIVVYWFAILVVVIFVPGAHTSIRLPKFEKLALFLF